MNNLLNELQREGFKAQLAVSGDDLVHVSTGIQFRGILDQQTDISPGNLLFSDDPRESDVLHVLRSDCPAMAIGDRITDAIALLPDSANPLDPAVPPDPAIPAASAITTWKIMRRSDSPGDPVVKFWLLKVTIQDS